MTKHLAKKVYNRFKVKRPFEPNFGQIAKKALLLLTPSIPSDCSNIFCEQLP